MPEAVETQKNGAVLNLTQHRATTDQLQAGIVDLPDEYRERLISLLNFEEMPDKNEISNRAEAIARLVNEYMTNSKAICNTGMIGGAPYLMRCLERALEARGITPCYAFSARVCFETVNPDGTVAKQTLFKHQGLIMV